MTDIGTEKNEPGSDYWDAIEPYCEVIDIYDTPLTFLKSLAGLPRWCRHLLAVHWCDSEICNGGFHQFFYNSTGILAPEAVEGFQAMRLESIANVVKEAMLRLGEPYARDREERWEGLARLESDGYLNENSKAFQELDDRYYAVQEQSDLLNRMDRYARENAA